MISQACDMVVCVTCIGRSDGLVHDMTLCQAVCDIRFWLLVSPSCQFYNDYANFLSRTVQDSAQAIITGLTII